MKNTLLKEKGKRRKEKDHAGHKVCKPLSHFSITLLKKKGKRRKKKDHAGHKVCKPLSHFSIALLKKKAEPTPNRVQSSLLELPRCEGGKDCEQD